MRDAIVLQFCSTDDAVSQAIQWMGHSWCSHVDSVLEDGRLLGARAEGGVQIRPHDYQNYRRTRRIELPAPPIVVEKYYQFLHAQLGKLYDHRAIMGFIAGRDWRDSNRWFCSELVAAGLEAAQFFPFPLVTPSNKMMPGDLLLICSTRVLVPVD